MLNKFFIYLTKLIDKQVEKSLQKQANKLAKAGLKAYNHNIDTSPNFYKKIITTRTFQERIDTIKRVRKAGITVCCGGIIGMGEKIKDRAEMLKVLSNFKPHISEARNPSLAANNIIAKSLLPLGLLRSTDFSNW